MCRILRDFVKIQSLQKSLFHFKKKLNFRLYNVTSVDRFSQEWQCKRVFLSVNGTIDFSVRNLRNKFSYFGLDQIDLFDPLTSASACDF
ncbi:hypothetical protein B9Z55_025877 [Caenorhabditis nigoni]|uniref:Uncharacterized protein n=1 Tax=Caenorhabditis nigoni TaxID=1611254 RepID=A0A2G5T0L5_9PELO|nr:hypothetical protein B9Z55_025877 [Caenorhabditis nigoni]